MRSPECVVERAQHKNPASTLVNCLPDRMQLLADNGRHIRRQRRYAGANHFVESHDCIVHGARGKNGAM